MEVSISVVNVCIYVICKLYKVKFFEFLTSTCLISLN